MKKILSAAVIASALMLPLNSAQAERVLIPAKQMQVNTSETYGIPFESGWVIFDQGESQSANGVYYTYLKNADETQGAALMKYKQPVLAQDLMLSIMFQAENQGWKLIDKTVVELPGYNALRVATSATNDNNKVVNIIYIIEKNEVGYMLAFTAPLDGYNPEMYDSLLSNFNG